MAPKTLRGRVAAFFALVIVVTLVVYGGSVYLLTVAMEDAEQESVLEKQTELAATRRHLLHAIALALPLSLVLATSGAFWLTRRAFQSLTEVVRIAGGIDADRLGARIPPFAGAGDEIEQLVAAQNAMLARIERSVGGLRRFTADAAHELRTPLAAVMGSLEICLRRPRTAPVLRQVVGSALEELAQQVRLLDSLLLLSRADAGQLLVQVQPVALGPLLRQVVAPYEAVASERQQTLHLALAAELFADSDPLLLSRVVANLIDNACKFTPPGGRVWVTAQPTSDGTGLLIEVADSGPGVAAADRLRVFDRFFRSADFRGSVCGHGLGLPIARDLAQALGATLSLAEPAAATGARFCLSVPARWVGRRST